MIVVKKPKLKRDWEGRYVRLKGEHRNKGGGIFHAGEIMLVERNHGGLHLARRKQCPRCKEHYLSRLNRVQERDVELLPEDYIPEEHLSTVDALRAEVERLKELAVYSSDEGTHVYWRDIAQAKTEKMNEWAQTIQDVNADAARYRVEAERLRQACLQVRRWGIELASLLPEERDHRFEQLWPHINDTLRTAVLEAE